VGIDAHTDADIMDNGFWSNWREMIPGSQPSSGLWSGGYAMKFGGQDAPRISLPGGYSRKPALDPGRPCSYASNSLEGALRRDVAGLMDFIRGQRILRKLVPRNGRRTRRTYLDEIIAAFSRKPIVISEYDIALTPDRPEGDGTEDGGSALA